MRLTVDTHHEIEMARSPELEGYCRAGTLGCHHWGADRGHTVRAHEVVRMIKVTIEWNQAQKVALA